MVQQASVSMNELIQFPCHLYSDIPPASLPPPHHLSQIYRSKTAHLMVVHMGAAESEFHIAPSALFGTEGEKCAARIRVSGSEAAFAILGRVVVFPAFCVMGGRRTRVRREAFGGIFPRFSLIRNATRSQTGPK